ncbi:MAG: hypothetical protein ABR501_12265 [Pyrinomonadaceae bacterium]
MKTSSGDIRGIGGDGGILCMAGGAVGMRVLAARAAEALVEGVDRRMMCRLMIFAIECKRIIPHARHLLHVFLEPCRSKILPTLLVSANVMTVFDTIRHQGSFTYTTERINGVEASFARGSIGEGNIAQTKDTPKYFVSNHLDHIGLQPTASSLRSVALRSAFGSG